MISGDQASKPDLWGRPFSGANDVTESPPVVLLRQQADALTARTNGLIEGHVLRNIDRGTEWTSLYAKVPSLQGYMYKLISIARPIIGDPDGPLKINPIAAFRDGGEDGPEINTMDEFADWLGQTLSSDQVHAVISNLLRYIPESARA